MDYRDDPIGKMCFAVANTSKATAGFGAVLLRNGEFLGSFRNRRSLPGENDLLGGGVDYSTHAEQAALAWLLGNGHKTTGCELYVLGVGQRGPMKGLWAVRGEDDDTMFSCVRCAKALKQFDVSVHIPLPRYWHRLSPQEALDTATEFRRLGRKRVWTPIP